MGWPIRVRTQPFGIDPTYDGERSLPGNPIPDKRFQDVRLERKSGMICSASGISRMR